MTAWLIITLLILIGLALINIEIVFVPGTTIVGLMGVILAGAGIFYTFKKFDNSTGFLVLGITLIFCLASIIYFFKNETWKGMALHDSMKGRVNEGLLVTLEPGTEGVAISSLRPYGKAEFLKKQYEVCTVGDYVEAGTKISIIKIEPNKILVEPIKS